MLLLFRRVVILVLLLDYGRLLPLPLLPLPLFDIANVYYKSVEG